MSESKYRDWILETIDSLRSRKARPDLERICRMVRRRHGSDPDRTREELEKLIQEQTVLKVSYKGSISYRNAAKVQRKSRKKSDFTPGRGGGSEAEGDALTPGPKPRLSPPRKNKSEGNPGVGGSGKTSSDLGERLIASVRRLAEQNRASALRGETRGGHKPLGLKEILGYLTSQDGLSSEGKLTRNRVKVALEREVARGRLRRTRCGNITLPVRGVEAAPAPSKPPGPANRLLKSEAKEEEPMETESEEDEEEKGTGDAEDGGQSDTQTSGGEEGSKWVTCPAPLQTLKFSLSLSLYPPSLSFYRFVKSELGSLNPVNWTVSDVVSYFTSAGFPEQALAFRTQVR
uniref:SAMD1-like winged helix (WH) domain-containing protein n=1 Tax=Hucho hucho TaxID=62062 RepID=A0A4W5MQL0_9TELE